MKTVFKRYFIDAMSSMAYGLFASLIIGTIIGQIGSLSHLALLNTIADVLKANYVYGAAIGAAISIGLKADPLVIFSTAGAGAVGCVAGGPVGAYLAALVASELGQLVSKKTPVDIVLTPLAAVLSGGAVGVFVGPYINIAMQWLGNVVNSAVELMPFLMGMIVGAIVGMVLTLPISSAALCIMLGLSGLAGGAATAGCAAQMIGFAVISFSQNGVSGLISQGIGTSMLQVPNILRHPQIWIAPTVASAVCGALSAAVFRMTCTPIGAGMGTSGLVGPIATFGSMAEERGILPTVLMIIAVHFVIPAVISLSAHMIFRRVRIVKDEYLKLAKI